MLKVLHVSAAAERGGLEVIMLNIVKCLDRSRFMPQVLFLTDGPFVEEVKETGAETHVINAGRVREVIRGGRTIVNAVRLIRDQGIGLVHTHNSKAHIYGGLAARIAGVPCLLHLQGVPKPSVSRDGLVSFFSVVIPAYHTIACSNYVAQAFQSVWHASRSVGVVHSGVITDAPRSAADSSTVRKEFGIRDEVGLIVMAARLQRWKGIHDFIDSAAQVVEARPDVVFMVVGGTLFGLERGYPDELHRQVELLGLNRSVIFTGYRPDVTRFFAAADVVVHGSIEPDPFPTVLLEAMVWARPVIASDTGGPIEIVEHGVTGLLVRSGRPDLLAQAILHLIDNPERRLEMGRQGAARVRSLFNAARMTRQIEGLYEEMMAGGLHSDQPKECADARAT